MGPSLLESPHDRQRIRRLGELPKDLPLVVMCHHGMRSAHSVHHLREADFDALNLAGGIDAWSREVDALVPLY
jgi:rhodanese-related sulfurtransferase